MRPKIILTIIATVIGITAVAQNDLKLKLDSIANSGIEKGIPGIQILISDNDSQSIYNYGSQDINKTNEINDSTNWRYGSITKLFTAVMILQLESEKKLSIDDFVSKYVDLNQHNDKGITIKQLLNHTSGLYNYTSSNRLKWEDTMNQCLEYSLKRKLNSTPGSEYSYCNTGYVILGLIIEKVTKLSYQQNITERIFEPCGLKSMIYCNDEKTPSNTARGYKRKRKKHKDFTEINHSWANSAGAVLGNLSDLNQFVNCLFSGSLIDSVQLKKMITPTIIYRDLNTEGLVEIKIMEQKNPTAEYVSGGESILKTKSSISTVEDLSESDKKKIKKTAAKYGTCLVFIDTKGLWGAAGGLYYYLEWFYHAVGLCWNLNLDKTEKTIYVSHGGSTQGYNCDIHYNTQNNLTIAIGMNLFPSGEYEPVFSTQNQLINTIHEYYKKK